MITEFKLNWNISITRNLTNEWNVQGHIEADLSHWVIAATAYIQPLKYSN
jgi:hypothetical protein